MYMHARIDIYVYTHAYIYVLARERKRAARYDRPVNLVARRVENWYERHVAVGSRSKLTFIFKQLSTRLATKIVKRLRFVVHLYSAIGQTGSATVNNY